MAAASSSETSLKITCQNSIVLKKNCCFIEKAVQTQITHFVCYNDAVCSAKYCSLKIPADKGIFISALRWWLNVVFISLFIEQLSGRES
jgi:hypothetical protein